MPYNPIAVANYFIDLAKIKGDCVSPMKLQKLIYYVARVESGSQGLAPDR